MDTLSLNRGSLASNLGNGLFALTCGGDQLTKLLGYPVIGE